MIKSNLRYQRYATNPKGIKMLNGFEEDLAGIEVSDEVKAQLLIAANKRAAGLSAKNGDVIGTNTALKAQVAKLEQDALDIKRAAAEAANDVVELNRINAEESAKNLTSAKEQALLLEKENIEIKSNLTRLLIDGGLSDALDVARINPALKAGAVAMLRAGAMLTDGKAMIGDKSLSDAVTEWANSDVGKSYCLAPNNSGGNANGGGGGGQGKSFAEMTLTEKTVLLNTDPNLYNQLKGT